MAIDTKNVMVSLQAKLKATDWKKLPKWCYGAVGGAVLLVLVLIFCGSGSIRSDEDFMDFYDDAVEDVKDESKEAWRRGKEDRSEVLAELRGDHEGRMSKAVSFAVRHGSLPALVYLLEEKAARFSGSFLDEAAGAGNLDIVEYLIEEQGFEADRSAMRMACIGGHVDVCKYLVENGADATDVDFLRSLCMSKKNYQGSATLLSASLGKEITVDELKERYLEVAEYLIEQGVDVTDQTLQAQLNNTDHNELVALIRKAAK